MPGRSMWGDESKKMGKDKLIQNTEKQGTDLSHRIIWKPVKEKEKRKKKKKKEKEKEKQLASAWTLWVGSGPAPSGLLWRFGTSYCTDKS